MSRILKNKPLLEAIVEIRWLLQETAPDVHVDPHYKVLVGRLYDRVASEYPEHEVLPTATLPDELVPWRVQHRFRSGKDDWPVIQVGPGILTVNDTHKYTWDAFRDRTNDAAAKLFEAYPDSSSLKVKSLLLRYIDAIDFDYSSDSVLSFLAEYLKVTTSLPSDLFENMGVNQNPQHFRWESSFTCEKPLGMIQVMFSTGKRNGQKSLIWETRVVSEEKVLPEMPSGFSAWLDSAHTLTDDWFFKLIEGELERRFS